MLVIALVLAYRGELMAAARSLPFITPDETVARLTMENQTLRAALARAVSETPPRRADYIPVPLYSRYPFNDRDRITIDRGSEEGLTAGTPVFAAPDVLLGAVREVRRFRAVAETIFDPGWRSSVVVGVNRVKAVLSGGTPPRLELIPQESALSVGDVVMNIDPAFPMGAVVGLVDAVEPAAKNAWLSATLSVGYRLDALDSVLVPGRFP